LRTIQFQLASQRPCHHTVRNHEKKSFSVLHPRQRGGGAAPFDFGEGATVVATFPLELFIFCVGDDVTNNSEDIFPVGVDVTDNFVGALRFLVTIIFLKDK
jgi:hypothetical protein